MFLSILVFTFVSCGSALMNKENVIAINKELSSRTFSPKKDIFATYSDPESQSRDVLFRRGQKLKIWVESQDDWIKVRAIKKGQSIENSTGTAIIYIIRDILEDEQVEDDIVDDYPIERLKQDILKLLK